MRVNTTSERGKGVNVVAKLFSSNLFSYILFLLTAAWFVAFPLGYVTKKRLNIIKKGDGLNN